MKHLFFLLPFIFASQHALAIDAQDEESYKQQYGAQVKPLVIKKLSADHPEMPASAIQSEADFYISKMAGCQLEGLSNLPEAYQEKAILPVAAGEGIEATTHSLNAQIRADVEAGNLSKDKAASMLQNAQQAVQVCLNS